MTGVSDSHINADQCKVIDVIDKKVEVDIVSQTKHCVDNEALVKALNGEVKQCTMSMLYHVLIGGFHQTRTTRVLKQMTMSK